MHTKDKKIREKYFSKYKKPLAPFPDLLETQVASYTWLIEHGLKEVFTEFSPIVDYSDKKFSLEFLSFYLSEPKYDEHYAKANKLSYEAQVKALFV